LSAQIWLYQRRATYAVICLNVVVDCQTSISSGNRVILAGKSETITCYSSHYVPPSWLFYGLSPAATPCTFDSGQLRPGIAVCPSAPRISVSYSSYQRNRTTLVIRNTQMSDAGTYTCGSNDPSSRNSTSAIIVGVIGKCTQCHCLLILFCRVRDCHAKVCIHQVHSV